MTTELWVMQQLEEREVERRIPLNWSVKKCPSRLRNTRLPLIYGYVIVFVGHVEYVRVLSTAGVFGFVRFADQIPVIPDGQIELWKFITGENLDVEMTDVVLEPGDQVEIIGGELTGISGELVEFKGKHRVLMRIDKVGLSFLIEVPKSKLRAKS